MRQVFLRLVKVSRQRRPSSPRVEPLTLKQGRFFLSLAVHSWDHATQYHRQEDLHPFLVKDAGGDKGVFQLNCAWEHQPTL